MKLKDVMLLSFVVVSLKAAEAADDGNALAHSKNLSVLENPLRLLLQTHGSRLKDQDIFAAFQGHEALTHEARRDIQHRLFDAATENLVQQAVGKGVKKQDDGSYIIEIEEGKSVETDDFMIQLLLQELRRVNQFFIVDVFRAALKSAKDEEELRNAFTTFAEAIFNGQTSADKK